MIQRHKKTSPNNDICKICGHIINDFNLSDSTADMSSIPLETFLKTMHDCVVTAKDASDIYQLFGNVKKYIYNEELLYIYVELGGFHEHELYKLSGEHERLYMLKYSCGCCIKMSIAQIYDELSERSNIKSKI